MQTFENLRNIYLVMALCLGGELFGHFMDVGHFTEAQAAILRRSSIRAIYYVYGNKVSRHDLKPENRLSWTKDLFDQGGGKWKGSFAMYLEPWHGDVFDFPELRKNHGKEEQRARDLFYAMWVPDLFMRHVTDNVDWMLFCPYEAFGAETDKGLLDVWGEEFKRMYTQLEVEGKGLKIVKVQQRWFRILEAQMETGTPYMSYVDRTNHKSDQQNPGTIHSSNLCAEINEYTSRDEVVVCNLASIALPAFARKDDKDYDFQGLYEVTKVATENLNKVADRNYYPVEEARRLNMHHRSAWVARGWQAPF
jgi:ribonucleotide reductase alpha subunit